MDIGPRIGQSARSTGSAISRTKAAPIELYVNLSGISCSAHLRVFEHLHYVFRGLLHSRPVLRVTFLWIGGMKINGSYIAGLRILGFVGKHNSFYLS